MGHSHPHHHHDHGHAHAHGGGGERSLVFAIILNLLLTLVQIVGGVVSGSLALLADALHNFSDCGSLIIALVAERWSRQPADARRTFGYRRAGVVGALINLTALVMVAFYLLLEAVQRLFHPEPIEGWTVIIVAAVALVVDLGTVLLLWATSKDSLNIRAALLHNLSDAFSSIAVILVGVAVLIWDFYLADVLCTALIAGYILWQSTGMIRASIAILMNSAPKGIDAGELATRMRGVNGVVNVHHLHLWQLNEQETSLEAHIVILPADLSTLEAIKHQVKHLLSDAYGINHSTLEFEVFGTTSCPGHSDSKLFSDH